MVDRRCAAAVCLLPLLCLFLLACGRRADGSVIDRWQSAAHSLTILPLEIDVLALQLRDCEVAGLADFNKAWEKQRIEKERFIQTTLAHAQSQAMALEEGASRRGALQMIDSHSILLPLRLKRVDEIVKACQG